MPIPQPGTWEADPSHFRRTRRDALRVGWLGGLLEKMPATSFWLLHAGLIAAAAVILLVVRSAGSWVYFNAEQIRRRFLELLSQAGPAVRMVAPPSLPWRCCSRRS